jgi:SAM-dependent methyltransferase
VYDETREPLEPEAVDRLADFLVKEDCKKILEVGVGTGRIAAPLHFKHVNVTGVDLSRRMLERAMTKGVTNIAMADANHLPFRDRTFDAVMMAHVLHLLDDPELTFLRVSRAAKRATFVMFRRRDPTAGPVQEGGRAEIWQAFRKAAEQMGYDLPSPFSDYMSRFRKESDFLARFPPDEAIVLQDVWKTTTLGERLEAFQKRAYGFPAKVSDEAFQQLVERIRSTVDLGKEIRYRRVEQLGVWRTDRLADMETTRKR